MDPKGHPEAGMSIGHASRDLLEYLRYRSKMVTNDKHWEMLDSAPTTLQNEERKVYIAFAVCFV